MSQKQEPKHVIRSSNSSEQRVMGTIVRAISSMVRPTSADPPQGSSATDGNARRSVSSKSSGSSRSSGSGGSDGSGDDSSGPRIRQPWSHYSWTPLPTRNESDTVKDLPTKSLASTTALDRHQNSVSYHHGISTRPRRSIVLKHLDSSSGSDEDLGVEALRIMRQRKKERQHIKQLGPLIPIGRIHDDRINSLGTQPSVEVTRSWEAVPLRTKRAETRLIYETQAAGQQLSLGQEVLLTEPSSLGSTAASSLHKSSMADPIRSKKRKSVVNFGFVAELEFSDADSDESLITNPD